MSKRPKNPQALFQSAVRLFEAGNLEKAERTARKLAKDFPGEPDLWNLRAQIALRRGKHDVAAQSFRKAAQLRPAEPALWNNLGNALRQSGAAAEAADAFRKCLELRPGDRDVSNSLGNALIDAGQLDAAEEIFESLLARDAADDAAVVNLSYVYTMQRRSDAVVALLEGRLRDAVLSPAVCNNLASNLAELGRLDEAAAVLARGLAAAPDDADIRYKNSTIRMLLGDWEQGWRDFDARWQATDLVPRPFAQPRWNGEALAGKSILVWGEQGIGDEIMFASMLPDLLDQAERVVIECDSRLAACFRRSFPGAEVAQRSDPPAAGLTGAGIDFQVAAGDLGRWLRPGVAAFPGNGGFLEADADRTAALRAAYRRAPGEILVGLTWRSANLNIGDLKSLDVRDLAPVLAVAGCRFVNLQYGDTGADMAALREAGIEPPLCDPDIDPTVDFDGHLAQVAAMDVVVSASNSTVHAAGALDVPTLALIRHMPDRRWLMDREDTPWYRSVRLLRQQTGADWSAPVARAAAELKQLVAEGAAGA